MDRGRLAVAAWLAVAGLGWGAPIALDIQAAGGVTAVGFVELTPTMRWDQGTALWLGEGVSVGWTDWVQAGLKDRGGADSLLRDFLQWSSSTPAETIKFAGLAPGAYGLTVWATDASFPDKRTSFGIDGDSDGVMDIVAEVHNPLGVHSATVAVTVGSAGVLTITVDGIGTASGAINGLMLTPEPATAALMGLGALAWRRRRVAR